MNRLLNEMPDDKKERLTKILNFIDGLTSNHSMSTCEVIVYKEGFYLKFDGLRSTFTVYAEDCDGELVFKRKPKKLEELWSTEFYTTEDDFSNF